MRPFEASLRPAAVVWLCALSFTAACQRDLEVPQTPPVVTDLVPAAAFAGSLVKIVGHDLGSSLDGTTVHFGQSGPVHPRAFVEGGALVAVPDDASSGPVQLSTITGAVTSARPFTFKGAGRLRLRQQVSQTNVRQSVAAIPLPARGQTALYSSAWSSVQLLGSDGALVRQAPAGINTAVAHSGGAGLVAAAFWLDDPACGNNVSLWDFPAGAAPVQTCLPQATPVPTATNDYMAASPDGAQVVLMGFQHLWFIDRSAALRVVQTEVTGVGHLRSAAWRKAGGFVIVDGGALRLVDTASGKPSAAVPVPSMRPGDDTWLDVRENTVAVSGNGKLVFADVSVWPPVFQPAVDAFGYTGEVAFSEDGRRLLLTDFFTSATQAVLWDLTVAPPRPLNSTAQAIYLPHDPVAGPDGTFYVGSAASWYVLSAETGAIIASRLLPADLTPPRLIKQDDGTLGIQLFSRTADSGLQFDAVRLEQLSGSAGFGAEDAVSGEESADFWVLSRGAVLPNGDGKKAFALPAGSWTGQPQLSLAPGGTALLLRYQQAASGASRVVVLDPKKQWPGSAPAELASGQPLLGAATDGQGRVALVSATSTQLFDLQSALAGTVAKVGGPQVFDASKPSDAFIGDGDRLLTFYRFADGGAFHHLRPLSFTDGALLPEQPLPASAEPYSGTGGRPHYDSMVVAPGGRRVYWLTGNANYTRKLITLVLDPVTGLVAGEEQALPMPPGARDLLVFPDGESLLVLDPTQDLMLLYR
jgi:hypothetical protein